MKNSRVALPVARMMSLRDSACSSELGVHHPDVAIEEARAVEFAQNSHDPAGAVNVLDMHIRHRRGDLAETWHASR